MRYQHPVPEPESIAFFLVLALMMIILLAAVVGVAIYSGRSDQAKEGKFNSQVVTITAGLISALFMMSLVFLAATSWQNSTQARLRTYTEAGAIAEIYALAAPIPEEPRAKIRSLSKSYLEEVKGAEWTLLAVGDRSEKAGAQLSSLRNEIIGIQVSGDAVKTARDRMMDRVREATDARRMRISDAESTPSTYLTVQLLLNGLLVIAVPMIIGYTINRRSVIMQALVALSVAVAILVVTDLTRPFSGVERVTATAYSLALDQMH
ncbi:DUF4239 domain-containing protein [Pseudonocardiaceae bacterium YIM PH 21723]|nr:DUF4239 domain-containing protein [Pseudonocardiaceae bacterium YIM PH 21723]